jgi:chlorite dismutase
MEELDMAEAPDTLEGWYALHEFLRVDHAQLRGMPANERDALREDASRLLETLSASDGEETGSTAAFRVIGHKADVMLLCLRPTVEALGSVEAAIGASALAPVTTADYSYLSVTELSLYEAAARGGTEDTEALRRMPHVRNRLYPAVPPLRYVSFYPMNKRRGETVNWYAADLNERRRMMREHGATGRRSPRSSRVPWAWTIGSGV